MATTLAPSSYSQPSRKGKKAWRKNVDIEPVTTGLESARQEYRQTGGPLIKDLAENQLFQTDTAGSQAVRQRAEKRHGKLKADEIIEARSKIPAVEARKVADSKTTDGVLKRKRDSAVSAKDRARLWRLANSGGNVRSALQDVPDSASFDPWAAPESAPAEPHRSFLDDPPSLREPKTLREKPISMTASGRNVPSVPKPNAGRSYNPNFDAWLTLKEHEEAKALSSEQTRLRQEAEERERAERAAIAAADADRAEQDRAVMSEYESDWEGFQSEPDEAMLTAKRPERKTPAERNKVKRRKAAEAWARHERKAKEQERQERQLQELTKAAENERRHKLRDQTFEGFSSDEDLDGPEGQEHVELAKRPAFGNKFRVPDQDLELVMPDELQDSLRRLKPEGNLLKDRYRTMILQGRTEGRTPIPMQEKPRRKATEKWSYKDWSLENA
ncbi:MAG: hypothetical protein Q9162_001155 [Coniocarpon cinnabarinum]